jgi:hypothetical protein
VKRDVYWISLSAGLLLLIFAHAAPAEPPSSSLQGDPKLSSQRRVVHPPPALEIVERDAEQAAAQIEQRERDEELARKEIREPERRPNLDHDVVQGIQSRNIDNVLRRQ